MLSQSAYKVHMIYNIVTSVLDRHGSVFPQGTVPFFSVQTSSLMIMELCLYIQMKLPPVKSNVFFHAKIKAFPCMSRCLILWFMPCRSSINSTITCIPIMATSIPHADKTYYLPVLVGLLSAVCLIHWVEAIPWLGTIPCGHTTDVRDFLKS